MLAFRACRAKLSSYPSGIMNRLSAPAPATLAILLLAGVLSASTVVADEPALRWWRGNLHTHSLWSDGDDFPEMIADWYREQGYHFLALSDHNILSEGQKWMKHAEIIRRGGKDALAKYRARFGRDWVETRDAPASGVASAPRGDEAAGATAGTLEIRLKPLSEFRALLEERGRFLLIPGEEISDRAEGVPVHLNATNLQELILPHGGKTVREAIAANVRAVEEQAKRKGREILVHLNHPNFGLAITAEDMAEVLSERFFEVYNGHPSVKQLGDATHPKVELLWDIANTIRLANLKAPPLYGIATDDSHDYHGEPGARPGRGWVMVQAKYLTPEHIIRALKAARFYASSGVTIRETTFDAATGKLEIAIEGEEGLEYTTDFIGTPIDFDRTVKPAAQPAVDANAKPIRATKRYSADVGKTFATVKGVNPTYTLTGKEFYIRAVVTSSRPHPDPSYKGQKEQAWTQPVGWERWLEKKAPAAGK
jgi:hypothetical protein